MVVVMMLALLQKDAAIAEVSFGNRLPDDLTKNKLIVTHRSTAGNSDGS